MPNRILKESIKTSEEINRLSWFEEVVFERLIVTVDDYGCFDGRVIVLKNELFPTKDNVTRKAIEDAVAKLERVNLLTRYEVEGRPYIHLNTFEAHQRVRNQRRKYPEPPQKTCQSIDGQLSDNCQLESESNPIRIQSESETESESKSEPAFEAKYDWSPEFESAWNAFCEMRSKKKDARSFTDEAKKRIIAKLQKLSPYESEQIAILDESTMNGWSGVFALKEGWKKKGMVNVLDL